MLRLKDGEIEDATNSLLFIACGILKLKDGETGDIEYSLELRGCEVGELEDSKVQGTRRASNS